MKRIDVTAGDTEYTFRTNESGCYLFEGVQENRQISCESGFDSLDRAKRFIRKHLQYRYELSGENMPRLRFKPSVNCEWKK